MAKVERESRLRLLLLLLLLLLHPTPQDKKDFVMKRVKRLIAAGVTSALVCMVKADSAILTDQTKELLAR